VYANETVLAKFGGKEGVRAALYTYLDGQSVIKDLTKPTNALKPKEQSQTNYSVNTKPIQKLAPVDALRNADIQDKIWAIKSEKIPKERDTPLGRKAWELEQKQRIQELENKLK
jgi:hypothetical protein